MKKIIKKYQEWNPSKYATILLLITPFLVFLITKFCLDNDFWFIINTGKTILKDGFIHIEPFTIHEGLSFIPQQWLTAVIFYFIYHNFGVNGMFFLIVFINIMIIFLFYRLSYLECNNRKQALLITIFFDTIMIALNVITTRPQIFDILIFTIELFLLESFIKKNNFKYLYFIPLLSLFLINLHASMWLILFVLLLPYYVENIILKIKKEETFILKPLVIVTIISFLTGFLNPYNYESIIYLFNSYGIKEINSLVNEMKSVTISNINGFITFGICFFLLYSFYYNKSKNKIRFFLLAMGIIYLALSHFRGIILLILICPLIMSYNMQRNVKLCDFKIKLYEKIIYFSLSIICVLFVLFKTERIDSNSISIFADYLDNNASYDIKLYTNYNDGGYMEYRGYKCYIDPRAEVFLKANNKKEDIFIEYYDLLKGNISVKDFLFKYQFDYLLVTDDEKNLLNELKDNNNYEQVLFKNMKDKFNTKYYLFKAK